MLHYRNRNDKIHILTMDYLLLEDIHDRITEYPGMESVEVVRPGSRPSTITAEDVLKLARDTITSRVLIFDVRRQTTALLQRAYSDIIRFNRPDLNHYCYTVLIGDGPICLFQPGIGIKSLPSYITELRNNFSAAVYFGDPFISYSPQELQEMAIYENNSLPDRIPERLGKYFNGDRLLVEQIRRYFRAASKPRDVKLLKRKERQKVLQKLCVRMIQDDFPDDKDKIAKALSKDGLSFPGETLKVYAYPFFFEEGVLDLFRKAKSAV